MYGRTDDDGRRTTDDARLKSLPARSPEHSEPFLELGTFERASAPAYADTALIAAEA